MQVSGNPPNFGFYILSLVNCYSSPGSVLSQVAEVWTSSHRPCVKHHQTFQVPKMEVLSLIRLFWGWVFPYISRIHTAYIGVSYLQFRYLKCLVKTVMFPACFMKFKQVQVRRTHHQWRISETTCLVPCLSWLFNTLQWTPQKKIAVLNKGLSSPPSFCHDLT